MSYKECIELLKKNQKWIAFSAILFLLSFVVGIVFPGFFHNYQQRLAQQLLSVEGSIKEIIITLILTNIKAALLGVVLGFAIVPSAFLASLNGYIFGAITSNALTQFGLEGVLIRVLPHGVFEIPAAIISYAVGISIGFGLLASIKKKEKGKGKKIAYQLFSDYKKAFQLFVLVLLPLIIVAGVIEGFLFKYQRQFIGLELQYLFYSLVLLYLFYTVLELIIFYREKRDTKILVIVSFVLIIASDMWMRAYGLRIKELFERFGVLISLLPLVIFLFYIYWENQRFKEQAAKKQIKDAFQHYLPPTVIEELLRHPDKLKLGGEKKELTVFFSDIRNFATISEKFSPEKLVSVLNEYLSAMTEIIIKNKGVVDKYIGDEIMAFWNAPLDVPDHPKFACQAALEMINTLEELQKKWDKEGISKINIGIGLNTGDVVVGNMGSLQRFNYTAIGDNVNLASRLETLNKIYGCPIIISEFVYEKVKDDFVCRELDFVRVKGREKPTRIYELICKKEDENKEIKQFITNFEEGLRKYRKAEWKAAIVSFKKSFELRKDKASDVFIERCHEFEKKAPKKWDGVFEQKTKT